jgi:SpoVK/Ycf46/Vps4 family AAA+-type ATPase
MNQTCSSCAAANRAQAKFCKRCGQLLQQKLLAGLVGLPEIRAELKALKDMTEGRRLANRDPRVPYTTLIMGKSGTAKSRLGPLIASELHQLKWTSKPLPEVIDAHLQESLTSKTLEASFTSAKGGVLFIDNAHKLLTPENAPTPLLNQLMKLVEASPLDPVVVLAGLPFGLREFIADRKYNNLVSRFRNVFKIDDYAPAQLVEVAVNQLQQEGLSLSPEARTRMEQRMRWLHRESHKPDGLMQDLNGHLATKEAFEIADEYYKRRSSDGLLLPQDIKGEVEVVKTVDEVLQELNDLIGLDLVKQAVTKLRASLEMQALNGQQGPLNRHFIFTGNPGTGKTTVARILANVFHGLGVLPTSKLVEVDRSSLVAGFVGQTGPLVQKACDQAMGGVLFIDEAYSLVQGPQDSFGQEAINTLLKRMEDDRGKFIVIAAGYTKEMQDFLNANSGLPSRFSDNIEFEDYDLNAMQHIFMAMVVKKGLDLEAGFEAALTQTLDTILKRRDRSFANARTVRQLFDKVLEAQAMRITEMQNADLDTKRAEARQLRVADLGVQSDVNAGAVLLERAMAQLNALVGLDTVKDAVAKLRASLEMQALSGQQEPLNRHFIFTGNPGTGKTTVARILADIFHGLGMLPTNRLVEVDRSKLVGQYLGHTAPLVQKACDQAMGGVLFVDEAYSLVQNAQDNFGMEAINTLLKRMEDDRGKFVVIAAGYTKEMQDFLNANSGLPSRFSDNIEFEDYDALALQRIFMAMVAGKSLQLEDGFELRLADRIVDILARRDRSFANARTVRQLFDKVREAQAQRVSSMPLDADAKRAEARELRLADLDATAAT